MIVLGVGDKLAALLIITGALSVVLVTASVLLLISRDKKFVTKEKLSCCNRKYEDT